MARLADDFPVGHADEHELYLDWLSYLRCAVIRKASGITDEQARWTPNGALLSLVGIVNHLTGVETRWIDGYMRGTRIERNESEFSPTQLPIAEALATYSERAEVTDTAVRAMPLNAPCGWGDDTNLRWVLIHLINETARHAGHADATRELLDGTTGE